MRLSNRMRMSSEVPSSGGLFDLLSAHLGPISIPVHLAVADDELRPVMSCVLVTKEYIIASDAHVMVRHRTDEIFTDDFIEKFPCDRFLIHGSAWAKMCESQVSAIGWSLLEPDCLIIHYQYASKREYNLRIKAKSEDVSDMHYPKWQAVIPNKKDLKAHNGMAISPKLLLKLHEAMTPLDERFGVILLGTKDGYQIDGYEIDSQTIVVLPTRAETAPSAMGIIMPIMATHTAFNW